MNQGAAQLCLPPVICGRVESQKTAIFEPKIVSKRLNEVK